MIICRGIVWPSSTPKTLLMRIVSLQSGSNGNCIYVESQGTRLLFDAGLTGSKTRERLDEVGIDISSIHGVLISHDHSDHIRGAGVLNRKFGLPVWMTCKTFEAADAGKRSGNMSSPTLFQAGERIPFGKIVVETIPTPHDAADGVGFIVDDGTYRFGILTDLGHVFPALEQAFSTLDGVLVESNYDLEKLAFGNYPDSLKQRIRGKGGHLSNVDAAHLIQKFGKRLQIACLGHLSEENNEPELALETHRKIVGKQLPIVLASRYECSELWNPRRTG